MGTDPNGRTAMRMNPIIRVFAILAFVVLMVGCDQATKTIAKSRLETSAPQSYLLGVVSLQYAENAGAFLSVGARLPRAVRIVLVMVMTALAVTGFLALLLKAHVLDPGRIAAFSLLCAGAFGNLIDRIIRDGNVVDFLIVGVGPFRTAIFNIADVLLLSGMGLLLLSMFRRSKLQQ